MQEETGDNERQEEDGGLFDWPIGVYIAIGICVIGTLIAIWSWPAKDPGHYRQTVHDALWTTYSIGNPHTVALGNIRPSLVDPKVLCGRINYEKAQSFGGGWSGYTDFFMEEGVVYIAATGNRYAPRFAELCLTTGVDRP